MNRVSDCSNLKLYDRILRIRSSVCRVAGSSTRLVGNWSLLLFVCGVLCLPVMSVIAASSNSDNQAEEITGTPTLKILIKEASLLLLFHMGITI